MITIDKEAVEFIKGRSGSIVIALELQPAMGSCCGMTRTITGSYIPKVSEGEPNEKEKCLVTDIEGIKVYYPKNLQVKEGFASVRIRLKKSLMWGWLEIEGAKATAIYSTEE